MVVKYNLELITSIYQDIQKPGKVAEAYAKAQGVEYTENIRKAVSKLINKHLKDEMLDNNEQVSDTAQYSNKLGRVSARKPDGSIMTAAEFCEFYGLPKELTKSFKLITHNEPPTYNLASVNLETELEQSFEVTEEMFTRVVGKLQDRGSYTLIGSLDKKSCGLLPISECAKTTVEKVLKIIITDVHVGAEVNGGEKSLYGGKWDKEELEDSLKHILDHVVDQKNSFFISEVIIEDLGDLVDGWNGQTTRTGHSLPQNMDNESMFDNAMQFKSQLVKDIRHIVGPNVKITMHSICNDNHGGSFTYVVNSGVKHYLEAIDKNVEVVNHRKFITHYMCGNHAFILSHGKDDVHLKFGFKVPLDQKGKDKIEEYMKRNDLFSRGYFVSFNKGDTHVQHQDSEASSDFSYNSFMALSPATQWVQHNFQVGYRGFNIQTFDKNTKGITTTPVYL